MPEPEFRKPIFNFVWVRPLHTPPEQIRFIRVGHRGIFRVIVLALGTLALAAMSSISIAYLITTRNPIQSVLLAALLATLSVVVFRGWIVGTYVNDHGIKIIRVLTTDAIPWSFVQGVERVSTVWNFAGIPIGLKTPRVVIRERDNSITPTHIYVGSIDGIFTTNALATLQSMITRWWRAE